MGRVRFSSARTARMRSMAAMTLSYFRPTRVVSKTSLPAASRLMLIASRPGLDHAPRHLVRDQRPVADEPDFPDANLLRVADLLDQLPIDERLAVVVHPHVRDAERGALVRHLPEQRHVHDALLALHLVARAEHALGVADVGALDLDDLGQHGRAVAPGGEQQAADGLARWRAARVPRLPGLGFQGHSSDGSRPTGLALPPGRGGRPLRRAHVVDDACEDLVEPDGGLVANRARGSS